MLDLIAETQADVTLFTDGAVHTAFFEGVCNSCFHTCVLVTTDKVFRTIANFEGVAVVVGAVAGITFVGFEFVFCTFLGGRAAVELRVDSSRIIFTVGLAFVVKAAFLAFCCVVVHTDFVGFVGIATVCAAVSVCSTDCIVRGTILETARFCFRDTKANQACLASTAGSSALGADIAN